MNILELINDIDNQNYLLEIDNNGMAYYDDIGAKDDIEMDDSIEWEDDDLLILY